MSKFSEQARPNVAMGLGRVAVALAWLTGMAICLPVEFARLKSLQGQGELQRSLIEWNIDTTPFFLLLVIAAPFILKKFVSGAESDKLGDNDTTAPSTSSNVASSNVASLKGIDEASGATTSAGMASAGSRARWSGQNWSGQNWSAKDWGLCLLVCALSIATSYGVSRRSVGEASKAWGELPPAYHDEYSYLFQAETFLQGSTWTAIESDVSESFDQMHVLNEGRFASRYFPGTGVWLAPFVKLGVPHFGYWLAGGLAAGFVFATGRELSGRLTGVAAGVCLGVSPGAALFSNLFLAHHPTLLWMSIFYWSIVRLMRRPSIAFSVTSGFALSMAMLCRPMTAAGLGLPFGIWIWSWGLRNQMQPSLERSKRWKVLFAMGLSIAAVLACLFAYNKSITGSGLLSPYQLYTDLHTPRHVYGFNNVVRGEQRLGPKVIDAYDRWAENLTPERAVQNVWTRIVASSVWTLGIVPLAMGAVLFVASVRRLDARWICVGLSVVTIHLAHVPYWFTGIMNWHYVFESILPLCLIAGWAFAECVQWGSTTRLRRVWMSAFVLAAVIPSYFSFPPFWTGSRVAAGIETTSFSQLKYARVDSILEPAMRRAEQSGADVLLLVENSRDDVHVDYVTNSPGLDGPLVRARLPENQEQLDTLLLEFSDRTMFLLDATSGELKPFSR